MTANTVSAAQLTSLIERIERLLAEKKGMADDIKDVFGEAKSQGFDIKTMRDMIKLRAQDKAKRQEAEALRDMYAVALQLDLGL
jgi:uncharacterized protein (UPF0335 family)